MLDVDLGVLLSETRDGLPRWFMAPALASGPLVRRLDRSCVVFQVLSRAPEGPPDPGGMPRMIREKFRDEIAELEPGQAEDWVASFVASMHEWIEAWVETPFPNLLFEDPGEVEVAYPALPDPVRRLVESLKGRGLDPHVLFESELAALVVREGGAWKIADLWCRESGGAA